MTKHHFYANGRHKAGSRPCNVFTTVTDSVSCDISPLRQPKSPQIRVPAMLPCKKLLVFDELSKDVKNGTAPLELTDSFKQEGWPQGLRAQFLLFCDNSTLPTKAGSEAQMTIATRLSDYFELLQDG